MENHISKLEAENSHLKEAAAKALNSNDIQYNEAYNEIKQLIDPEEDHLLHNVPVENTNPMVTIEAQNKLIKLLMVRLKETNATEESVKKKEYHSLIDAKIAELSKLVQQQSDDIRLEKELLTTLVSAD